MTASTSELRRNSCWLRVSQYRLPCHMPNSMLPAQHVQTQLAASRCSGGQWACLGHDPDEKICWQSPGGEGLVLGTLPSKGFGRTVEIDIELTIDEDYAMQIMRLRWVSAKVQLCSSRGLYRVSLLNTRQRYTQTPSYVESGPQKMYFEIYFFPSN